jgi:hypothetical protein
MPIRKAGCWPVGGKQVGMTTDQQTAAREGEEKYNLLHERFSKLGSLLKVVLVCFASGVGTSLLPVRINLQPHNKCLLYSHDICYIHTHKCT